MLKVVIYGEDRKHTEKRKDRAKAGDRARTCARRCPHGVTADEDGAASRTGVVWRDPSQTTHEQGIKM